MDFVLEGCSWFFKKQLIVFEKLLEATDRSKISLVHSPLWLKIGPCPPECDKKDFMHAVSFTFEGMLNSKVKGEFCRLKIQLDVCWPLRRGIFISTEDQGKFWLQFKFKNLPNGPWCERLFAYSSN